MERSPLPLSSSAILIASLMLFTGTFSWGYSIRTRAAQNGSPLGPSPQTNQGVKAQSGKKGTERAEPKRAAEQPRFEKPVAGPQVRTVHQVRAGETLTSIATLYRVSIGAIREANGLTGEIIRPGDRLTLIGAQPLKLHRVVQGDTLWELAARYGYSIDALSRANRNVDPGHLQIGQELLLPPPTESVQVLSSMKGASVSESALQSMFAWPVLAPVSSTFGPRWGRNHAGIDLAANHGDPIRAARDGQVLLAGTVQGYGETVVLQHPDGTRTLYAHSSVLRVSAGQRVKQGDLIALVGSTGQSTGPHLHFEIIVGDRPRDPLIYLPPR